MFFFNAAVFDLSLLQPNRKTLFWALKKPTDVLLQETSGRPEIKTQRCPTFDRAYLRLMSINGTGQQKHFKKVNKQ